jgi:phosphohistidine phosphatase SixA
VRIRERERERERERLRELRGLRAMRAMRELRVLRVLRGLRAILVVVAAVAVTGGGCGVRTQGTTAGAAAAVAGELTVVLVRHAEKVDDSADPALSEAGVRRAAALADALRDADVGAIYTTQFRRTRDTAAPLARRLGIDATVVQAGGPTTAHARAVAERVLAHERSGTVLVVGHSNTVPAIIQALGAADVGEIADDEYHHLFIVQVSANGARLIRSRY